MVLFFLSGTGILDVTRKRGQMLTILRFVGLTKLLLGYLIDINVLQDCIETNVGDVTFDVSDTMDHIWVQCTASNSARNNN